MSISTSVVRGIVAGVLLGAAAPAAHAQAPAWADPEVVKAARAEGEGDFSLLHLCELLNHGGGVHPANPMHRSRC